MMLQKIDKFYDLQPQPLLLRPPPPPPPIFFHLPLSTFSPVISGNILYWNKPKIHDAHTQSPPPARRHSLKSLHISVFTTSLSFSNPKDSPLFNLRSSPAGCPRWRSCPGWWPCWWCAGCCPSVVAAATGSWDWWWRACPAWSPSPSPSAVARPRCGAALHRYQTARLSPFLIGPMFVREPSWEYSANLVGS